MANDPVIDSSKNWRNRFVKTTEYVKKILGSWQLTKSCHLNLGHIPYIFQQTCVRFQESKQESMMSPGLEKGPCLVFAFCYWLKQVTRLAQLKRWGKSWRVKLQSNVLKGMTTGRNQNMRKNRKEFLLNRSRVHVREHTLLFIHFTFHVLIDSFEILHHPLRRISLTEFKKAIIKKIFWKF